MNGRGLGLCVGVALLLGAAGAAHATNGMNMIGYDAISAGMGGADAAVETGCAAVAANPANLSSLCKSSLLLNGSFLGPSIHFANQTQSGQSNDVDGESQIFPLPFIAYASRLGEKGPAIGVGIFAQGGMGVDIVDVNTGFGTQDRIYSNVRYMRFAPTFAYPFGEKLALGATIQVGYSDIAYEFFPETSFYNLGQDGQPGTADDMSFPGQKLESAKTPSVGARFGARYEVTPQIAVGGSYTTESSLDYKDGDLTLNMTAMGIGDVLYEGSVDGFTWPATAEFGVACKALGNRLTVAGDVQLIQWSSALETVTVRGENPDNAMVPANLDIPFVFNWDDQTVFSLGASYTLTESDVIRLGGNFGNNPIPDEYVYPLFPATVENHVAVGYGRAFGKFYMDVAYERGFNKEVTNPNTNPMQNPFGPSATIEHAQNTVHVSLTYRLAD